MQPEIKDSKSCLEITRKSHDGAHSPANVEALLSWGKKELQVLGPREALLNAEQMLEEVLKLSHFELHLKSDQSVSAEAEASFREMIERRKSREPLAYILGKVHFWNETLLVNPNCLVPRQETEVLIERFIENSGFKQDQAFRFLDLGSGSGVIGLTLLQAFHQAQASFIDLSKEALEVTRKNLEVYGLLSRSQLICSDLFEQVENQKWDAIVANPPYLSEADWKWVEPELHREPRQALDGGKDGLDFYRRIAEQAAKHLNQNGLLMMELGFQQLDSVKQILQANGFHHITSYQDYLGHDRVIEARS